MIINHFAVICAAVPILFIGWGALVYFTGKKTGSLLAIIAVLLGFVLFSCSQSAQVTQTTQTQTEGYKMSSIKFFLVGSFVIPDEEITSPSTSVSPQWANDYFGVASPFFAPSSQTQTDYGCKKGSAIQLKRYRIQTLGAVGLRPWTQQIFEAPSYIEVDFGKLNPNKEGFKLDMPYTSEEWNDISLLLEGVGDNDYTTPKIISSNLRFDFRNLEEIYRGSPAKILIEIDADCNIVY